MKKILLKCLLLGLCIGAVESELVSQGIKVEPAVDGSEILGDSSVQPTPVLNKSNTQVADSSVQPTPVLNEGGKKA